MKPRRTGGGEPAAVKPARVVAELGRPETPEETAARKAEASRKHRANQTPINLALAIGASLGIVLILVLAVVRPDQPARDPVDYSAIASQSEASVDAPLAAPALPPGWVSNSASLGTGGDGIPTWSVGFVTPEQQFIALRQGIGANDTWVANQLEGTAQTGSETIDGVHWATYDNRDGDDPGNLAFAMVAAVGESDYVLYGTADDTEFRTLAAALTAQPTEG
ncbi:MAG: hypothetical protein JWL94_666 [Microbacteriaceae bacterium]|nr:hypothetical protein [Microbacteriaceae bacterium]